jgi:predicted chitinase
MTIRRDTFFAAIRATLFAGHMTQPQVDGIAILVDEGERRKVDVRWIAYVLATAFHETAQTMRPIREIGLGEHREYGKRDPETGCVYYGRGYVQLTWRANYQKLGDRLGVDLVYNPDLALEPPIASKIIWTGMIEGLFTGDRLLPHFRPNSSDWVGARRIINGLDRAGMIARYAIQFNAACQDPDKLQPPMV